MKNKIKLLIASCCCAVAGISFAQSRNSEVIHSYIEIKKSFENAGPISEQDMPVQSEWFCDKYTFDLSNSTLAYYSRQFDEQDSWQVQQLVKRANFAFLKINGEVFEFTSEGLESGGMFNSLFRKTHDGQILVRTIELSDNPNAPMRTVSYGTCLKH